MRKIQALKRRLQSLGYDEVVARLHTILGLEPKYLRSFELPPAKDYAPGEFGRILRDLERIPGAEACALRGRVLRILNRSAPSLAALDKALRAEPKNARWLAWRGELLGAPDDLRKAAGLDPKDPWPLVWEAAARMAESAGPETFAALGEALRRDPRCVCALLLRAAAFDRVAKPEAALADAALAAKLAPSCSGTLCARGRLEAKLGRVSEALSSFASAARLEPDAKNHYGFLVDPHGIGSGPDGVRLLDAYLRKNPAAAWAWALRGDSLRSSGSEAMEAGMADLLKAVRLDPATPWMRACLARSRVQYKYAEQGIKDLKEAIRRDPRCAWLHSWLGESFRRTRRWGPAAESFRLAVRLDPRFAQAHLWLGRTYCDQGKLEEGAAEFAAAVEIDSSYGFAFAKRGETLARLGRHAEALPDFDRALNLPVPFAKDWIRNLRSRSRLACGDYDGACADLEAAARAGLKRCWVALDFSEGLRDKGPGEEALAALDEGCARNPDDLRLRAWRGAALLGLGRLPEAVRTLDQALQAKRPFSWAYGWRGRARWLMGQTSTDLDRAITEDAACPWLWSWRSEQRLGLGETEKALQDAERSLALAPREAHGLYCRGEALRRLGRRPEARAALDAAVSADLSLAPAYISRGVLLGELGEHEEQLKSFSYAAALAPGLFRRKIEEARATGAGEETARLLESLLDSAAKRG